MSILCCCPLYPYPCPVHCDDGGDDGVSASLHSCTIGVSVCTRGGMYVCWCKQGCYVAMSCMGSTELAYTCMCALCSFVHVHLCVLVWLCTTPVPIPCMYLHKIATCSRSRGTGSTWGEEYTCQSIVFTWLVQWVCIPWPLTLWVTKVHSTHSPLPLPPRTQQPCSLLIHAGPCRHQASADTVT